MKKKLMLILSVFVLTYVTSDSISEEKSVFASSEAEVILGGQVVGIKLYSDGIMLVDFEEGSENPALKAGLKKGDIILTANGKRINGTDSFVEAVLNSSPRDGLTVSYIRGGRENSAVLYPSRTADGGLKVGMWVRDSVGGVGTVTCYSEAGGKMITLGHSVTDTDTGESFIAGGGFITDCEILSVEKSIGGTPGEIYGMFKDDEKIYGTITENRETGLYADVCTLPEECTRIKIAPMSSVHDGGAILYSDVAGNGVAAYSVSLKRLYSAGTRNFAVTITDERLLALTGGIIQGMSGSPIVQGGRLVGALTHVCVNTPESGYGIYIENMLDAAG